MKEVKVSNCYECPFCNIDNSYGRDSCNLDDDIYMDGFDQMPDDKVHENCPLLKNNIIIKYEK